MTWCGLREMPWYSMISHVICHGITWHNIDVSLFYVSPFTSVYGLLAYLTSYLCKPEHKASELMKKAGKEASGLGLKEKFRKSGNVFYFSL